MPKSSSRRGPLKSLRQALRDLLRRHKSDIRTSEANGQTIGSGILRRACPTTPLLPNVSAVSVFPDFSNHYSIHHQLVKPTASVQVTQTPAPRQTRQTGRLLPQTSLSNFNLYFEGCRSVLPQPVVYEAVPEPYQQGASRQASLVTLSHSSSVNLRPPESRHSLRAREPSSSDMRSQSSSREDLAAMSLSRTHQIPGATRHDAKANRPTPATDTRIRVPRTPNDLQDPVCRSPLSLVDHFKCFCVLDVGQHGSPVVGTSVDLRYIFDLGEQFFLNNHECEGCSIDLVSGLDANQEDIVNLILYSPLIVPSTGGHRYMLISLVDVTEFIKDSAGYVPELDTISEDISTIDEVTTPPSFPHRAPNIWSDDEYRLSSDDLLGGCTPDYHKAYTARLESELEEEDIWLTLAAAENQFNSTSTRTASSQHSSQSHMGSGHGAAPYAKDTTDDSLEKFMKSLQDLHSHFFLLSKSPLADHYEICSVSPMIAASTDWKAGLSCNTSEVLDHVGEQLDGDEPFTVKVRWGLGGAPKQIYCSPLFMGTSISWVCYLVDEEMGMLW
jgi:hypothetical protein